MKNIITMQYICSMFINKLKEEISFKKILNIIYFVIIILLVVLGIYYRTKFYLDGSKLWLDEILLANNIFDKNIIDFFKCLEFGQVASPFFLSLTYLDCKMFGYNEYTFRLIPYLTGILSVVLFYFLLKENIHSKIGKILGLLLFCVNVPLIYYSGEFKQYSCDVFICLLLLNLYKYIDIKNLNFKKTLFYTSLIIIFLLSSLTSFFVITAILLSKIIEEKNKKTTDITYNSSGGGILALISVIFITSLYYYIIYKQALHKYNFFTGWEEGYLTFSLNSIYSIVKNFINFMFFDVHSLYLFLVLLIFMLAGLICLYKENRNYAVIYTNIFILMLITSYYKYYSLSGRLILFFIPICIILPVKTTDIFIYKKNKILNTITALFIFVFLIYITNASILIKKIDFVDFLLGYRIPHSVRVEAYQKYENNSVVYSSWDLWIIYDTYKKYLTKEYDLVEFKCYEENKTLNEILALISKNSKKTLWFLSTTKENGDIVYEALKDKNINLKRKQYDDLYIIHVDRI